MKIIAMTVISLCFAFYDVSGQQKVNNRGFNTVLKILLKHDVNELTVPEAINRRNAMFLDAREKKEYDVSHIKHSVYVGYDNFNLAAVKNVSKTSEIIVYCSIGKRSEGITKKLTKAGYTNVKNLYGGIFEWVNQSNEVVDANNQNTKRVHAYGRFWGQWLDKGEKVFN